MPGKQPAQHHSPKSQTTGGSRVHTHSQPDVHASVKHGREHPGSLSHQDILALQSAAGNQAVAGLVGGMSGQKREQSGRDETGLPAALKASAERLSGASLDDVRVHFNSSEPQKVGALAYTRGTDIHLRPGQEQHLAHEVWHVVQQKQGRVAPTLQMKNESINDDSSLETEADAMGEKTLQMARQERGHGKGCGCASCAPSQTRSGTSFPAAMSQTAGAPGMAVIQRKCEICGDPKHKTSKCPQTKQQRDQHKEQVKSFQAAKQSTISSMRESEESGGKGSATEGFTKKHMVGSGKSLDRASEEVAQTRTWGGGGESGRSTVVDISPEDLQKEARFQMESLKFKEAEMGDGSVAPKRGVNKPTKFDYRMKSSTVRTGDSGKRAIHQEEAEIAKPVLGLQGQKVHHLHGVDDE